MDLAGTERSTDSGAVGEHLDEMNKINDGLLLICFASIKKRIWGMLLFLRFEVVGEKKLFSCFTFSDIRNLS